MLKKMTVLAMAVGIVAAMVLPAAASASWKHNGSTLPQNETINLTGNAAFTSQLGGVTCQVTSETQFFGNSTTGEVETFDVHPQDETTNCKGTGLLAPCQIHNVSPQQGLNWSFHTNSSGANNIQITTQSLQSTLTGGFCGVKAINLTAGTVTATPNQPENATGLTLSGTLQAHMQTNSGASDTIVTEVSHSLTIEDAADKHTYQI